MSNLCISKFEFEQFVFLEMLLFVHEITNKTHHLYPYMDNTEGQGVFLCPKEKSKEGLVILPVFAMFVVF